GLVAPNLSRQRMRAIAFQARKEQVWPALSSDVRIPSARFALVDGPVGQVEFELPLSGLVNDPIHADLLLSTLQSIEIDEPFASPPETLDWEIRGVGHAAVLRLTIENAHGGAWRQIPPILAIDFGKGPEPIRLFIDHIEVDDSPWLRAGLERAHASRSLSVDYLEGELRSVDAALADPESIPSTAREDLALAQQDLSAVETELAERLQLLRPRIPEMGLEELRRLTTLAQPTGHRETDFALERVAIWAQRWFEAENVHAPMAAMLDGLRHMEPNPEVFQQRFAELLAEDARLRENIEGFRARTFGVGSTLFQEPVHPRVWDASERILLGEQPTPLRHLFQGVETWRGEVARAEARWRQELLELPAQLRAERAELVTRLEEARAARAQAASRIEALERTPEIRRVETLHGLVPGDSIDPNDESFWNLVEARRAAEAIAPVAVVVSDASGTPIPELASQIRSQLVRAQGAR
ncbi:MAG: hypothetical protein AAFQ82_15490, partial [Myxococcota bacterium]